MRSSMSDEFHAEMTVRGVEFQNELALYTANKVGLAIEQVSNLEYRRCLQSCYSKRTMRC